MEEAHQYFLAQRQATAHGDIRRCSSCGFVFTSPQFEESEYDLIYSRIQENDPNKAVARGAGASATERRYSRLRRLIATHTPLDAPFLDFGCGDGSFLRVTASKFGIGFEVGQPATRIGEGGNKILTGRFHEVAGTSNIPWESQSFVTAFDVFEHLPSLTREIDLIRRVIRPRGFLFVTVPDISSAMARASGGRWNMLLLEHLWYFQRTTLDGLLTRLGFEPFAHRRVPYDAAVGHIAKRLGEFFGMKGVVIPKWLRDVVLPVPAGVLFGAYRRKD